MAFVNKQGGAEKHETRAAAGQPIDFDPNDPNVVKVHYDLAAWTFDQRAELSEALADNDLPHAWDGEELIVPEEVEEATDKMFDVLESQIGPFPIGLDDDAESTEFGLDEWTPADRAVLTESLVESEIPHRWDGTTVLVARDAEESVDDLLDAIEAGELMTADEVASGNEPPENTLSDLFLAVDRLAKDPFDAKARVTLIDYETTLSPKSPPYAMAPRAWAQVVSGIDEIVARMRDDADGDHVDDDGTDLHLQESSDVIGLAQQLRELLRQYV